MNITYSHTIAPEEYNALRLSVGWEAIETGLAAKGLQNTAFIVCARDGEKAVGTARVITDYGYVVYIADVIVRPEYQGQGLGKEIMARIMDYIRQNTAPGQRKFVNLMAKKGTEPFYEKLGLLKRPTEDQGCGMTMWIKK